MTVFIFVETIPFKAFIQSYLVKQAAQSRCVVFAGYIGEFEIIDDHRAGKIVVNLTGRLNKVSGLINLHLHNKCLKL